MVDDAVFSAHLGEFIVNLHSGLMMGSKTAGVTTPGGVYFWLQTTMFCLGKDSITWIYILITGILFIDKRSFYTFVINSSMEYLKLQDRINNI